MAQLARQKGILAPLDASWHRFRATCDLALAPAYAGGGQPLAVLTGA